VPGFTLGIDVGGTFTDVVCFGDHVSPVTAKAPSTAGDQGLGVVTAIEKVGGILGLSVGKLLTATDIIVHGMTVGTNIMLEFNGARTYMLTTRGFRDIIDIRRNYKEAEFSLRLPPPNPIVPRRRRIPITERITETGAIVEPLSEQQVRTAARKIHAEKGEAIAVCYLFSFVNPSHELRTAEILAEEVPQAHVSLSHRVLPKIREFERFSTTVVDAYVSPALAHYLGRLDLTLKHLGFGGDLLVMRSNGGVAEVARAAQNGVDLVSSGPAGGVVAASRLGLGANAKDIITMDIGGTSCDVALIENGKPSIGSDSWISRYRISIPVIEVTSIGAGGGSIAWVDGGGALRIGPQSAGARPGPACYGQGGIAATVTDADLVLGYIGAQHFLGGQMPLDVGAARRAIERSVGVPLGLGVEEAAAAIFRVVNHNMANALRLVSVARGYDPRDFALMAFGGGGGIHAAALISELGIRRIVIPRIYAPVLCALGDILSDIRETSARGFYARSSKIDLEAIAAALDDMMESAESRIGEHARAFPRSVDCSIAMRYKGQTHEVDVPVGSRLKPSSAAWEQVQNDFHRLHKERYSFSRPGAETETIGLQVDRWAMRDKPTLSEPAGDSAIAPREIREVFFPSLDRFVPTPIHDAVALKPGFYGIGPLIVEESNTSIAVYPGQFIRLGSDSVYEIEVAE
jgi:N-methylhydantoinase A